MPILANNSEAVGADVLAHVKAIRSILEADVLECEMGAMLRDYVRENVPNIELMCEIHEYLSVNKIISKPKYRELWNK